MSIEDFVIEINESWGLHLEKSEISKLLNPESDLKSQLNEVDKKLLHDFEKDIIDAGFNYAIEKFMKNVLGLNLTETEFTRYNYFLNAMILSEIVLNNTFQVKSFHREVYSNSIIGGTMSNSPRTQYRTSPPKMLQSNPDSCKEAREAAMVNLTIATSSLITGCLSPLNPASGGIICAITLAGYFASNYYSLDNVKRKCKGGEDLLPPPTDDPCAHLRDSLGPLFYMTPDCEIVPHIPK
ncbi:MAG: hypothetical protein OXC03_02270 [Flavobacteriaceae bacterium]|nr:hypothetical protein [Flavobacteriaceae bacterium]